MGQPSEFTRIMATFGSDYEAVKKFGAYLGAFQGAATQLNAIELAHEWYLMDVPAETAARWASSGHLPQEAAPLIASGMTPELVAGTDVDPLEAIARLADAGIDTTGADLSALDER